MENDLPELPAVTTSSATLLAHGVRSAAALPIFVGGRHVSNPDLSADEPDVFDPGAVRLMKAICANWPTRI